ncbi:MAG: ABC transporter permease subunit [Nitrospinae bacterium]|nr:ABC transporter permease subunit [Nitrospinota bacterium]
MPVAVLGLFESASLTRFVRASMLDVIPQDFVTTARAKGLPERRTMLAESAISFLGLGFPPDMPTWGRLLSDAKDYLDLAPHWALFPGLMIFLAVISINYIGDGLRDALDPRKVL